MDQGGSHPLGGNHTAQHIQHGEQRTARGARGLADLFANTGPCLHNKVGARQRFTRAVVAPAAGIGIHQARVDPCQVGAVQRQLRGLARCPVMQEHVGMAHTLVEFFTTGD